MADTVDLGAIKEYYDPKDVVEAKVAKLAEMVKKARHAYAFTGAGISTAAKIPDFRGPDGVWTRQAQGRAAPASVDLVMAEPTLAHHALVDMLRAGQLKYVVSQNIDGLHLKSGIPEDRLSELHGNCFLEICWKCDRRFLRETEVIARSRKVCIECRKRVPYFCHCSKTKCPCGAELKDSVIHFGEDLPAVDLKRGFEHGRKADLCIVIGSSLRVTPAADIPCETVRKGGKLVIINLQKTPLDEHSSLNIYAKIDEVFECLMKHLKPATPPKAEAVKGKLAHPARHPRGTSRTRAHGGGGGGAAGGPVHVEVIPDAATSVRR